MAFEMERWTTGLADTVADEVRALYAWLASVTLADVAPARSAAAGIAAQVEQFQVAETTARLLAEVAETLREQLREDPVKPVDLVRKKDVIGLVGSLGRQQRLRNELIDTVTSSTAYRRLVAHVLYRGVKAYVLTENVFARKIPGASSLVRLGQRSINNAAPGLERAVDTQLSAFVEANIAEALRESRRYLEDTIDEYVIRAIAEEAWDSAAHRPLGDLADLADDEDVEEIVDRIVSLVADVLSSGRFGPVIEATIAALLEEHADDSPAELLEDLGLSVEVVAAALVRLSEDVLTLPAVQEHLENRLRARLGAFYAGVDL